MKNKNYLSIIVLIVGMLIGLSLLLYPTVSNRWNEAHQSRAIATYIEEVANLDNDRYTKILEDARTYNRNLAASPLPFSLDDLQKDEYNSMLSFGKTVNMGIMGYVDIPKISCHLPIYHGTDSGVMQVGIGHLEWTSLPVGGESSHCVLSGHRGLPSAKLFTNLDKLTEGDTFTLNVLDETLEYEVDRILIVEPDETEPLTIEKGKDYCTLMTCTPYGVNTHRLLVRGVRVGEDSSYRIASDAIQVESMLISAIVAIPLFLLLTLIVVIKDRNNRLRVKAWRDLK